MDITVAPLAILALTDMRHPHLLMFKGIGLRNDVWADDGCHWQCSPSSLAALT